MRSEYIHFGFPWDTGSGARIPIGTPHVTTRLLVKQRSRDGVPIARGMLKLSLKEARVKQIGLRPPVRRTGWPGGRESRP